MFDSFDYCVKGPPITSMHRLVVATEHLKFTPALFRRSTPVIKDSHRFKAAARVNRRRIVSVPTAKVGTRRARVSVGPSCRASCYRKAHGSCQVMVLKPLCIPLTEYAHASASVGDAVHTPVRMIWHVPLPHTTWLPSPTVLQICRRLPVVLS